MFWPIPEDIRTLVADRISSTSDTFSTFYRSPASALDADWPAFILEYADNENRWAGTETDKKTFVFNLYIAYSYDPNDEGSRELAEKAISDAVGELYRDVFESPDTLAISNGWTRASNVSWGYGQTGDIPIRMAMMQISVTVMQDRS